MRQYVIEPSDAGKRLDKWMMDIVPGFRHDGVQKALRKKTVRVNGVHADGSVRLKTGDEVKLFLPDELFKPAVEEDLFLKNFHVHLHILYEDENLILADKKPGLMVHPDDRERVNTLLTHIQAYLYQKGEYDSRKKDSFVPALCNRIDRFTGGIVIAAKNEPTLKVINAKIAAREVRKFYLCAVHGTLVPAEGIMKNYIYKPDGQRSVRVLDRPALGALESVTGYRTLAVRNGLSLVECELLTGRTHQIRAQMANAGHPLLGDSQYGDQALDTRFDRGYQALYAYRVDFDFSSDAGHLNYLRGRSFRVRIVAFASELFPGFTL